MLLTAPKKRVATIIVSSMKPSKHGDFVQKLGDESSESPKEEYTEHTPMDCDPALLTASEAIMSAVKRGDTKGLSGALQSFFQICDEMPHEEGEHTGEEEEGEGY